MSVLVVTGSSRGIGAKVATLGAKQGWAVCINSARSTEEAEKVAESIIKDGGSGHYVDYAASKSAVDTMTYGHAVEQADAGIRVNCVRPGTVWTEMNKRYMERDPEYAKRIIGKTPLGRAAEETEIANGILWLLSDEASYVTGAILDVSGGMVMP